MAMEVPAYSAKAKANLNRYEDTHGVMIDKFKCPLTIEVMQNPETINCGHAFESAAIRAWLGEGHNTCPSCNINVADTDFVPNIPLRRAIEEFGEQTLQRMSELERDKVRLQADKTRLLEQVAAAELRALPETERVRAANERARAAEGRGAAAVGERDIAQAESRRFRQESGELRQAIRNRELENSGLNIAITERGVADLDKDIQRLQKKSSSQKGCGLAAIFAVQPALIPFAMVGAVGGPLGLAAAVGVFQMVVVKAADRAFLEPAERTDAEKTQKEHEKLAQVAHVTRLREQQQQAQDRV